MADRISQQRIEKIGELRARGVNPYPYGFHRSHTSAQAVALLKEDEAAKHTLIPSTRDLRDSSPSATVAGRITARRKMGKIVFIDLRDSSGKIQLLLGELLDAKHTELLKDIDIGDIIGASGYLFRTKTKEPTIAVRDFTLLAKSVQPLPEKWHGLADVDIRHRQRYVDLIANPEVKAVFETRSRIITAVRQFMNDRGFIEVETPVLQGTAGGAAAKPFTTHHNALDRDFYLRIALELYLKRLIVGGFDKVYELGRVFRNEGISTKHNPEFTMMESYEAYADYNDVMKMTESLVSEVAVKVLGTQEVKFGEDTLNLKPPWRRLGLRQAVADYAGVDFAAYPNADDLAAKMKEMGIPVDPAKNWAKLVDELISTYVEPKLVQPTFLIDYPVSMSPLAKTKPDNDRVVERFEGFIGAMEVANAFTELNDPIDQRERFVQQAREKKGPDEEQETVDEDFLTAMEYGMPPTGGLGIGIDRLVMALTNQHSIREVILFPQLKEKPE